MIFNEIQVCNQKPCLWTQEELSKHLDATPTELMRI